MSTTDRHQRQRLQTDTGHRRSPQSQTALSDKADDKLCDAVYVVCRRATVVTTSASVHKDCTSLLCAVDVLTRAGTSKEGASWTNMACWTSHLVQRCAMSYCDGRYWSVRQGQLKRPMYKWLQSFKHSLGNDAAAYFYTASVRSSVIYGGSWPSHA